ncbi:MAG: carbohydrate porin [Candidatus Kapaibacterium sp.]
MASRFMLLIILLITACSTSIFSQESGGRSYLFGGWDGSRSDLEDDGFTIEAVYTGEIWGIASGPVDKKAIYCDNWDIIFNFDMEKLVGWDGATLQAYFLGNYGGVPGEVAGMTQGISNIAAPNTFKLFNLFYEQLLFNDDLSIMIGTIDLNTQFDTKVFASLFINPSHGIGVDWAQSGENGPSIFPTASLGLRLRFSPIEHIFVQAIVLDGVPGDPDNPYGTHIILDPDDGLLVSAKFCYVTGKCCEISGLLQDLEKAYTKFGVGFWYYTDNYKYIIDHITNWGFYAIMEQELFAEKLDAGQGLGLYARIGVADDLENQMNYFIGGGLVYTGLFSGRDEDQIGIAIASGHNSYLYRNSRRMAGEIVDPFEHNLELTYKYQLTPYLALQPNIQYCISPTDLEAPAEVLVGGMRLEVVF